MRYAAKVHTNETSAGAIEGHCLYLRFHRKAFYFSKSAGKVNELKICRKYTSDNMREMIFKLTLQFMLLNTGETW